MMVIVPNVLRDRINAALDIALSACPGAEPERGKLYSQLLDYYNEHGEIPDFTIERGLTKKQKG